MRLFGRRAAKEQEQRDSELEAFLEQLIDPDDTISPDNEQKFLHHCLDLGYGGSKETVSSDELPLDIMTTLLLATANAGRFPQCESSLLLKHGEVAHAEEAAALLKEVTDREFRGGSQGFSVPLGHGVRYRVGAMRGHMVTIGTHWQVVDSAVLTVTDQRVVYHGGRKTLEFPYSKLATLNEYSDAIDLGVTSRQATSSFRVNVPHFLVGMIRASYNASNA